jgi:glycosyltransferase involved in cell wall biosynthesis
VVAFDTGTTRDVVKDGETGRVVADGNIEALADAIVSLLDDPAMRSTMGEKARALARRTFVGWDERTDMEIEIIRDAMAS